MVNFDCGPLHIYFGGWREAVAPLLPHPDPAPATRMFLLARQYRGWIDREYPLAADWNRVGVAAQFAILPSLLHLDAVSPGVIAQTEAWLPAFIDGRLSSAAPLNPVIASGPGALLLGLLEAPTAPSSAAVLAVLQTLPPGPVERDTALPLLFLMICSADAPRALAMARRLAGEAPTWLPAAYAEVAILMAIGQPEAAVARATAWLTDHPADHSIAKRATMPIAPSSWQTGPGTVRNPLDGLDFAAGFLVVRDCTP